MRYQPQYQYQAPPPSIPETEKKNKALAEVPISATVAHACYIEKIGRCAIPPNSDFQDPQVEDHIAKITLDGHRFPNGDLTTHSKFSIIEDKFHEIMMKTNYSYYDVVNACMKHYKDPQKDHNYHQEQIMTDVCIYDNVRYKNRCEFFERRGFNENEAKCAAYVISFYTGNYSNNVSRSTSIVARKGVMPAGAPGEKEVQPILFYMIKALSIIPFSWTNVNRAVNLTDDELAAYEPGHVLTWIQFSSSKVGITVAPGGGFSERNTIFFIRSLTGRSIQHLSNYKEEEEVLFLPHSHFIVTKKIKFQGKNQIYLHQLELGLSFMTILWVDDRILQEDWENRKLMEQASSDLVNSNIRFVPKESTNSAMAFLASPFGKRLCSLDDSRFRIISDMTRDNEVPAGNAGARLLRALREKGIKTMVLIFTSNTQTAMQHIKKEFLDGRYSPGNFKVTQATQDAQNFIRFLK
eukprot:TRINITY_DN26877_c0_g1_i1.p1 TRINITY_DN26877_c0_g1~~TRINITY_DN26877_c0_g1_i1.p1  ORF type:complete len:465 (+),score=89.00 TRINITY_DN26877_c0_g1_i1:3-1397(+)